MPALIGNLTKESFYNMQANIQKYIKKSKPTDLFNCKASVNEF